VVLPKIEVFPLKRRDLAQAKTEASGNLAHRAIRLLQERNNSSKPVQSQNGRGLSAPAAIFHANSLQAKLLDRTDPCPSARIYLPEFGRRNEADMLEKLVRLVDGPPAVESRSHLVRMLLKY
jgi:hypothetical protein